MMNRSLSPWNILLYSRVKMPKDKYETHYIPRPELESPVWEGAMTQEDRKPIVVVGQPGWGRKTLIGALRLRPKGQSWESVLTALDTSPERWEPFLRTTNLHKNRRRVGVITPENLARTGWNPASYRRVDLPKPDGLFMRQVLMRRVRVHAFPDDERRDMHDLAVEWADGNIQEYLLVWEYAGDYASEGGSLGWPCWADAVRAIQTRKRELHQPKPRQIDLTSVRGVDTEDA